jgi:hypothetical protein
MRSRILLPAVALMVVASTHEHVLKAADDVAKLTVRLTPVVRVTRGDARAVVTVPRHADNRVLRVSLESEDYSTVSEVPLEGEDAPVNHLFYWHDLPPGSYSVTVQVYGRIGLRDSISTGNAHVVPRER